MEDVSEPWQYRDFFSDFWKWDRERTDLSLASALSLCALNVKTEPSSTIRYLSLDAQRDLYLVKKKDPFTSIEIPGRPRSMSNAFI